MLNRDAYIAKMKLQIDELNATMSELEAKEDARDEYKAEISKLRLQSQLVIDKFDELKAAGGNSWQNMVTGTERVRNAFIHSFHYFKSQL